MKTHIWLCLLLSGVLLASCSNRTATSPTRYTFIDQPISEDVDYENIPRIINEKTTLNDLYKYALLNNAKLKSAYLKWQAELLKVYPASALPDPQVSYTYYIKEVETRVGPQEQAISLMQMLPWFGKLDLKKAMQQESVKAVKAEYEHVKNGIYSKVEQLYYDYWYWQQAVRIAEENISLLESVEPVVRSKVKVGDGSKDLIKLQIEIGKVTDSKERLVLRKIPLDARLNKLLNRPVKAEVSLVAVLAKNDFLFNEENLLKLVQENPKLRQFSHMISASEARVELAEKNKHPDFSVGLKWIQTDKSFMDTRDNGKDPVMATVGFSLPWNQTKYSDLKESAMFQSRSINWARLDYENDLKSRVMIALFEIQDNKRALKLYRDTLVPKTEESLNISLQSYRNGKESFIGFVDLQRQLLQFQLMLEKFRQNIAKQRAVLEELTGQKLSSKGEKNHE